jgi:hypothetical protein
MLCGGRPKLASLRFNGLVRVRMEGGLAAEKQSITERGEK